MLTSFEIQQHARQVASTPGGATAVRTTIVARMPTREDAMEALYSVLLQTVKDTKGELEEMIKDLRAQAASLREQSHKLQLIAQRMQDLLPQLLAAVATDPGCEPTSTIVAARAGRLQSYLTSIDAAIVAAGTVCPPAVATRVRRYKALLLELPPMFAVPPKPPSR